ncbi:MAG: hypothetical protein CMM01_08795 [Rhodopirellula sp.]|nr:hypothetical protein [Rhodopirellula sp.]
MARAGKGQADDDGIHPLDRDYSTPIPRPKKRFALSKSRAINLGIFGFGFGGVILLVGIVLSQFGDNNRTFQRRAADAHQLGMWSILFGGGCIVFAMQTRTDKPGRSRAQKNEVLSFSIIANAGTPPLRLKTWKSALEELEELVGSQLTMDCLTPELEDVYLGLDGVVLAVLYWDRSECGVIRMRVRRRDLGRVRQCSRPVLEFLGACLVDDSTGVSY